MVFDVFVGIIGNQISWFVDFGYDVIVGVDIQIVLNVIELGVFLDIDIGWIYMKILVVVDVIVGGYVLCFQFFVLFQ